MYYHRCIRNLQDIFMYAKRVDKNQQEIVNCLRKMGAIVHDLSKNGKGIPDILIAYGGETILAEIKSNSKASYTPDQIKFNQSWKGGKVIRINNLDDAINLIQEINKKGVAPL